MTSLKHLFTVERCQASALLNVHVSLYFSLDGQMNMLQVTSYTYNDVVELETMLLRRFFNKNALRGYLSNVIRLPKKRVNTETP